MTGATGVFWAAVCGAGFAAVGFFRLVLWIIPVIKDFMGVKKSGQTDAGMIVKAILKEVPVEFRLRIETLEKGHIELKTKIENEIAAINRKTDEHYEKILSRVETIWQFLSGNKNG